MLPEDAGNLTSHSGEPYNKVLFAAFFDKRPGIE